MPLNLIFITPGDYSIEDNGIPGDNISVIKDGNGVVIFTFAHPADGLGFTVSTPGVNINVNITDSMGAANLTIGNLTNPSECPDSITMNYVNTTGTVTLVANEKITEAGNDAASDITAGAIILSAGTGVGTSSNALETRTGLFEAETTSGGINISNIGAVQIGGISADVDGLDVAATGNINFTNTGSIFLTESNTVTAAEVVHGGGTSGNVTLTALGVNSDIIGNVDNGAASAPRGSVTFTAGRDIQLGTIGADFNNDIISNNALSLTAGRDILIDGFADILSDNFGLDTGADLTFTAGRNIGILNLAGTSASVTASGSAGGNAIMNTGIGGSLTVNGPGSFGLGSTSGNLIVNADRILIDGGSGISAPSGEIVIRPRTDGRETLLGSATDAALALELSDTELNRIFTPNLTIGGANAGNITVIAPIAMVAAGVANNLTLLTGGDLVINGPLTVNNLLTLLAGDNLLSASALNAASVLAQVDNAQSDAGTGGVGRILGSSAPVALNGNNDPDTLRGGENINQIVHGNGDNDTIFSSGEGQYFGDAGNDNIFAGDSSGLFPELLDGGIGTDTLDTTSYGGDYQIHLGTGVTNFVGESFVNFENLVSGIGNDTIVGSNVANNIRTGLGNDSIDGGAGGDTMAGEGGNDTYTVDNAADVVIELLGEGDDRVNTSITYALAVGQHVEHLATTAVGGTGAINLTGNELEQEITGNAGSNRLDGSGGIDTLIGLAGNDTLVVDNAGDVVVEASGQGTDRVAASVTYVLAAGQHVERMSTTNSAGTTAIDLTGNERTQEITGNAGNNRLDGKGGADTLIGGLGNDTLIVDNAGDIVVEALNGGTDRVSASVTYALAAGQHVERMSTTNSVGNTSIHLTGNEFAQELSGNYANNWLTGAGGRDVMTGSRGNDTFDFNAVSESGTGSSTRDVITDFTDTGGEQDKINVATIDANTTTGANEAFVLDTNGSFSTGEIRQTVVNGGADLLVEFNNDADASADMSILLQGRSSLLGSADFTL